MQQSLAPLTMRQLLEEDRTHLAQLLCLNLKRKSPGADCKSIPSTELAKLEDPSFLAFGIFSSEKLVGGLTAQIIRPLTDARLKLDIKTVVLQRAFMNRSVGTQLKDELQAFCREHGIATTMARVRSKDIQMVD